MPEPLDGGRDNRPAPQSFEVNQREKRETAVRESQKRIEDRFTAESRSRTETQEKRRTEITARSEDNKRALNEKETVKKTQEVLDKRRGQDRKNPDSGNIINVVV